MSALGKTNDVGDALLFMAKDQVPQVRSCLLTGCSLPTTNPARHGTEQHRIAADYSTSKTENCLSEISKTSDVQNM